MDHGGARRCASRRRRTRRHRCQEQEGLRRGWGNGDDYDGGGEGRTSSADVAAPRPGCPNHNASTINGYAFRKQREYDHKNEAAAGRQMRIQRRRLRSIQALLSTSTSKFCDNATILLRGIARATPWTPLSLIFSLQNPLVFTYVEIYTKREICSLLVLADHRTGRFPSPAKPGPNALGV